MCGGSIWDRTLDDFGMTAAWDFPSKSLVRNATIQQLIDSGYTTKAIADQYIGGGREVHDAGPGPPAARHRLHQQARFQPARGLLLTTRTSASTAW